MKRLFTDKGRWTDEGREISRAVNLVLEPIVQKAVADGYDIRDLQNVLYLEVLDVTTFVQIERESEEYKQRKANFQAAQSSATSHDQLSE